MIQLATNDLKFVQVKCAFCRGSGKDPFGIMSWLSSCCVCGGRGSVRVEAPFERCAHCNGTGAVKTLTCTVCRGKGVLRAIPSPTKLCPRCLGSGDDWASPALDCLTCRGRGRIVADLAGG